jgi:hypothetical protein
MKAEDFGKTWKEVFMERSALLNHRTNLETELIELRNKIAHLDEVLNHLAPLAGLMYANEEEISSLGITDAIRSILKRSGERLSPQDIRRLLSEKGYDLTGLSAPMASIYKILSRLVDDSQEVEREKEGGRVYYRWKHPPITDEDIPF